MLLYCAFNTTFCLHRLWPSLISSQNGDQCRVAPKWQLQATTSTQAVMSSWPLGDNPASSTGTDESFLLYVPESMWAITVESLLSLSLKCLLCLWPCLFIQQWDFCILHRAHPCCACFGVGEQDLFHCFDLCLMCFFPWLLVKFQYNSPWSFALLLAQGLRCLKDPFSCPCLDEVSKKIWQHQF